MMIMAMNDKKLSISVGDLNMATLSLSGTLRGKPVQYVLSAEVNKDFSIATNFNNEIGYDL